MKAHEDWSNSSPETLFGASIPLEEAFARLRLRLLDLTSRNRLLNFRHTPARSLQFVQSVPEAIFRRVARSNNTLPLRIEPVPNPPLSQWTEVAGRLVPPDVREHARALGMDISYQLPPYNPKLPEGRESGLTLQTLQYQEDLGRLVRKLEREARLAIEETGTNMLHLVFGFLEYPEAPESPRKLLSPLVCVPVRLEKTRRKANTRYDLLPTGEDFTENLSLREKLIQTHGFELPELEEDEGLDRYFERLSDAIESRPNWTLRRQMTLTLLSFGNMLLVRDLDPENWPVVANENGLIGHPLVRQVFEGTRDDAHEPEQSDTSDHPDIDAHPSTRLPLVFDADSSQHTALLDVLQGRSLVIEGPPGTGKSQTITNLIASALQAGKKVLFVSEKLAALEVVRNRLETAGLGKFVLELHSNKANKKRMAEDLAERIGFRPQAPEGLQAMLESLEAMRRALAQYASLLNEVHGNRQELTVHKVFWRAERFRQGLSEVPDQLQELVLADAPETSATDFMRRRSLLSHCMTALRDTGTFGEEHPFWGFFPHALPPGKDLALRTILREAAEEFSGFSDALDAFVDTLGEHTITLDAQQACRVADILAELLKQLPAPSVLRWVPRLSTPQDIQAHKAKESLAGLSVRLSDIARMRSMLVPLKEEAENLAPSELHARAERLHKIARQFRFADCPLSQLEAPRRRLAALIAEAADAHERIAEFITEIGLDPDTGPEPEEILKVLEKLPLDLLRLHHPGLSDPLAVPALEHAANIRERLLEREELLGSRLYLDMLPRDDLLLDAIRTLRQGGRWYRVFQADWRKAVALHRSLSKSKQSMAGDERLAELESLADYRRQIKAWCQNPELLRFAGPAHEEEHTPVAELAQLARWQQRMLQVMGGDSQQLPDAARLRILHEKVPVIRQALETLARFADEANLIFPDAPVLRHSPAPNGLSRPGVVTHVSNCLETFHAQCAWWREQTPEGDLSSTELLDMAKARLKLPQVLAELDALDDCRALLGECFQGEQTRLEEPHAALAFIARVCKADLPRGVEAILLSGADQDEVERLHSLVERVQDHWCAVDRFGEALAQLGRFDMDLWAGPQGDDLGKWVRTLAEKTRCAALAQDRLQPWSQYVTLREEACECGLKSLVALAEAGEIDPDCLADAYGWRFYASIAESLFHVFPVLSRFNPAKHEATREEYARLDREIIRLRGQQVAAQCVRLAKPPRGQTGLRVGDKTEMALVSHVVGLTSPRTPIRQMFRRAGHAIRELKPCFMMGPQAVAQFLPSSALKFDLVVMDEASQLRPEQALGAIARGSQLVVVGDSRQLPPTSFFSRSEADPDADNQSAAEDAESILDVCRGNFGVPRTLRWHYRSRHESLIAFSNHHFYDGRLFVFPSPLPKGPSLGVHYEYVADGVYEHQMNRVEASRVVRAMVEHIVRRPDDSLGVVTLNVRQRDLIAELWEERRQNLPQADDYEKRWADEGLPPFIKNLENVQGDERDAILISTTFGKPPGAGAVRQNFGPISRQGGWRRLNVLYTRARKSVRVISSMRSGDILLDEKTPEGTQALRNYLEYAQNGHLGEGRPTEREPESDFEVAVIDQIRQWGYPVEPQLGVAGFRIDVAVAHPNHPSAYIAAVECDGATYHSGVSVRDRDRIRQEILESLGWRGRIWRIWSTAWFRNPAHEAARLKEFLAARAAEYEPPDDFVAPTPEIEPAEEFSEEHLREEEELVSLLDEEEGDLEVQPGDRVTWVALDEDGQESGLQVEARLVAGGTDLTVGKLDIGTPLAQAMLGATVGEVVVLRQARQDARRYLIRNIHRSPTQSATGDQT
ncbi:DUF4011 domain-containing protein [Pseudazoarcus pumilus]|uniref:DNA helicase n=1 Tax=Pseudazoarcus pumilus TaxID=2067960 RepID=A0A2I6S5V4_9RHOO|nr:DUF4011 domain-containing protein [Pseudazoarcus pumilus]AUN94643.1 hypothetical protein C0099_06640 [Pseudazoarcus pumilus]